MDSLTQIVLGAGVGELVLGKKIGNKAMAFGAIAGTLPDLDIIAIRMYADDLSELVLHRGYSHALLTHVLAAFPLAWLMHQVFKTKTTFKDWYLLWFLGFSTHAILDSFTTYGTRLFLPFTSYPVGFNNISVIDPLYTLPFMVILIGCLFLKRDNPKRLKWAWRAFYISSTYMALTLVVKGYMHYKFSEELKSKSIAHNTVNTSPTIFNNALWVGMGISDSSIYMGEYSLLQKEKGIDFVAYKRNLNLENGFEGKALETLKWYSQGAYILEKESKDIINFYVVKYGRSNFSEKEANKAFIFYYQLIRKDGEIKMKMHRPEFGKIEFSKALAQLWHRIWSTEPE
ncbi:MAG: metal-dependent hydrolase [Bacteroidia bacterium]